MILALTDSQLAKLTEAAAAIPHDRRDGFLRAVAARLEHGVDDNSVALAVDQARGDVALAVAS